MIDLIPEGSTWDEVLQLAKAVAAAPADKSPKFPGAGEDTPSQSSESESS